MIVAKAIKPARLRDKAMRLALLNAMRKAGTQIKKDFQGTTKTWKRKPKFEVIVSLTGPGPVLLVGTDDEIYGYVNFGTKPHPIFAGIYTGKSSKKVLAFPSMHTPKTTVGSLTSSAGSSGGPTVFTPFVMHPGTKARDFEGQIKKKREPWFKRQMERAMIDVAKASGHAM